MDEIVNRLNPKQLFLRRSPIIKPSPPPNVSLRQFCWDNQKQGEKKWNYSYSVLQAPWLSWTQIMYFVRQAGLISILNGPASRFLTCLNLEIHSERGNFRKKNLKIGPKLLQALSQNESSLNLKRTISYRAQSSKEAVPFRPKCRKCVKKPAELVPLFLLGVRLL